MKNLKMIGRKPKIYQFTFEEMVKDEKTGAFYQRPTENIYMTLSDPECDKKRYDGKRGCPCIVTGPPRIAHTMDDNDIYNYCQACGDYAFYTQNHLSPDDEYFKWAITGKANVELLKTLENEVENG